MKKVLILLSTYNGCRYLKEQCESLFRQKGVEADILARDDGSSGHTVQLLRELGVTRIIEGENVGACRSFLDLIDKAPITYDYYAFCDQDDSWDKDKLYAACSMLDPSDPDRPALYYCGQTITDAQLNPLYEHKMDPSRSVYANCVFNQMAGCTAVFNRTLLRFLKKATQQDVFGHDVWTYRLSVALDSDIYVDEQPHIRYRQHGNNVVGLSNSFRSKLNRAKDYIYKYKPSDYARELLKYYANDMSDQNRAFFKAVNEANQSSEARRMLRRDFDIDFNDRMLELIFKLKLLLKKM